MTGWKTWTAAISAVCLGVARIIEGATADQINPNIVYEGILTVIAGFGIVGIGHKIEKSGIRMLIPFVMAALSFPGVAAGETWYNTNQATIAWDAVTKLADDENIPAEDVIQYRVFIEDAVLSQPVEVTTAPITATSFVTTFTAEGSYYVGVKAERVVDGTVVGDSSVAWSNDPANCVNGEAFGIRQYLAPRAVTGLKKQ